MMRSSSFDNLVNVANLLSKDVSWSILVDNKGAIERKDYLTSNENQHKILNDIKRPILYLNIFRHGSIYLQTDEQSDMGYIKSRLNTEYIVSYSNPSLRLYELILSIFINYNLEYVRTSVLSISKELGHIVEPEFFNHPCRTKVGKYYISGNKYLFKQALFK